MRTQASGSTAAESKHTEGRQTRKWPRFFGKSKSIQDQSTTPVSLEKDENIKNKPPKWSLGILNDRETDEVPGSILLMSKESNRNEPLGLRNAPARTSASSLPSQNPPVSDLNAHVGSRPGSYRLSSYHSVIEEKKKTANGQVILEPQPDDSLNDPLNWPSWRRDVALISLGFYCMVGGGMTPILAAGFNNVAQTYGVQPAKVALTTGLYMLGLGLGSVIASPTAILFGKRPVYLVGAILLAITAIWCALSPNYVSLMIARIFMGIAVSPVECLPSATIAEIFFLHERAYRLGIYTLLLLGGKNLVPLVSAVIIQALSWQWVFWIVAMVAGFCLVLLFLFVPETFWDRTPRPKVYSRNRKAAFASLGAIFAPSHHKKSNSSLNILSGDASSDMRKLALGNSANATGARGGTIAQRRMQRNGPHVEFATASESRDDASLPTDDLATPNFHDAPSYLPTPINEDGHETTSGIGNHLEVPSTASGAIHPFVTRPAALHSDSWRVEPRGEGPKTPGLHNFNSPYYLTKESPNADYLSNEHDPEVPRSAITAPGSMRTEPITAAMTDASMNNQTPANLPYTHQLRTQPAKPFVKTLKPWNGRLRHDNWFKAAFRPFILFAYPAILWSTLVYSLSVGWLIVLSESVSAVYRNRDTYNFTALQTGLVYLSPFIGGILGTAVAGKVSDVIVRFLSRRNDGIYEPEFRLVMAFPVAITTSIGLMGFGWSAAERDAWIVPTIFFGIISFGCSLGSTTAITFAVDSYRQYAGEALVTLNFSKNIFHGLVFSLFFPEWLDASGSKTVFIAIGCIQLACLASSIPMYIFGKRARMWTVRKNMMEKF